MQASLSTQLSLTVRPLRARGRATGRVTVARRAQRLVVRAEEEKAPAPADDDFETKLKNLKGRSSGAGSKAAKRIAKQEGRDTALEEAYATMDFSGEKVLYEGPPSTGDLITNVALGFTLLWLPLTLASVGRFLWLRYKFTDKRILVESTSPLDSGATQIVYDQIVKVVTIGRGVGAWGDMVITLKNGDNVEFRSLPQYKELEKFIKENIKDGNVDPKGF